MLGNMVRSMISDTPRSYGQLAEVRCLTLYDQPADLIEQQAIPGSRS
jgi:hypothetical protein